MRADARAARPRLAHVAPRARALSARRVAATRARRSNECARRQQCLNATSDSDAFTGAEVFVASVPLEGFEVASDFFFPGGVPSRFEHRMVLVRYAGDASTTLYDFLPADPKSPKTAATLLSGGSVRGVVRSRRFPGLPGRKTKFVAKTRSGLGFGRVGVESAISSFHERFDTNLRLRTNDCHTHVRELTQWLTCEFGEVIDVDDFGNMRVVRKSGGTREDEDAEDAQMTFELEPVSTKGAEKVKKKSSGGGEKKKKSGKK